jgi:hypothetical protein
MSARTVTLELLRHGPAHNQLLSPLTPYLALCGNHDAETVHVGFEHMQLLRRTRGLRYQDGRVSQAAALEEASGEVSRLLAAIPSLTAEMGAALRGDEGLIHLRMVLSAAELSLLPFELARAPAGFPGQGQWLSLQTMAPIAVTRETRRVAATTLRWPDRPRLLVVAAAPAGLPEVPLRAHLLALRRALDPWLLSSRAEDIGRHVTVLPRASLADMREACARAAGTRAPYTHVHVLAHGLELGSIALLPPALRPAELGSTPYPDEAGRGAEGGYGLALHADGDRDRMDLVSGSRLAAALRCHPATMGAAAPKPPAGALAGELGSPAVVTVASCDSGNVGSVIAPGASVAHDLHEAGVPLVFASQFPLSMRGSARMAEVVYERLLRGGDPRALVHDLRQALQVSCPDTHDWASVVAYAALPQDIDAQVKHAQFGRALAAVDAALARRDLAERTRREPGRAGIEDIRRAMAWLEDALPGEDEPAQRTRACGRLANASKRVAHVSYPAPLWPLVAREAPPEGNHGAAAQAEARRLLEDARRYYLEVFRRGAGEAWPLVQHLAAASALTPVDRDLPPAERLDAQKEYTGWWTAAHVVAEDNARSRGGRAVAWAHASLVELYVLAQLLPEGHWAQREAEPRADHHLQAMMEGASDFDRYSLRRQLLRYADWWWSRRDDLRALPARLGARMAEMGVGDTHAEEG